MYNKEFSSPELTESGFSEEDFFTDCLDRAHRIARSVIIQESGANLELAVITGVRMEADALDLKDKDKVSKELLVRLLGRSLEELEQEQEEEIKQELAEWYGQPRFNG